MLWDKKRQFLGNLLLKYPALSIWSLEEMNFFQYVFNKFVCSFACLFFLLDLKNHEKAKLFAIAVVLHHTANNFGLMCYRKRISQNSFPNLIDIIPKSFMVYCQCAADFSLLNLPKGKSLGRSKPATNS